MSVTSVAPVDREVGGDAGDGRSPHHPVAAGRRDRQPLDAVAVGGETRTEDRQVVGRVIDRGRPHLAQAEIGGDRDERRKARLRPLQGRPVDRPRLAGRIVGVAPAEQESALLEAPVEAAPDVEHHRRPLEVEGGMRLGHGDRVADGAGGDAQAGQATHRPQARAAGEDHPVGLDRAGRRLDPDDPAVPDRDPVSAVRSRSSTPAAAIANE